MDFVKTQLVVQSIYHFAQQLDQVTPKIEDGVLTIRVVGEFSAGKTRVIREILKDKIPEPFLPISSQEAQTKLQLEISYGEQDQLFLIEKPEDMDEAIILEELKEFPTREQVSLYDPETHRLRLLIQEPLFILSQGDGYYEGDHPTKMFLIDTPGWNSGDDDLAEQDARKFLVGEHNLAIVYVCHANRLDGELNQAHLNNFLEALGEAQLQFVEKKSHLQVIITHCQSDSQQRLINRMQQRIETAWQDLGFQTDDLLLKINAFDFAEMSEKELIQFRQNFWSDLLKPLNHEKFEFNTSYSQQILNWQQDWDIRSYLLQHFDVTAKIENLIPNFCIDGQFIQNMNMTRLKGLSKAEIQQRLTERWFKQLNIQNAEELSLFHQFVNLPEHHPLSVWWNEYWLVELKKIYQPIQDFIVTMQSSIQQVDENVVDLQVYLKQQLDAIYITFSLQHPQTASFQLLLKTVKNNMQHLALDQFIATLLKLSILQSRYCDHYQHQSLAHHPVQIDDGSTWLDTKTGLMWAKISMGQIWENNQCMGQASLMNWQQAQQAAQNVTLAGFNNWRLPTLDELKTLILESEGYTCSEQTLSQPQENVWGRYWSSTSDLENEEFAWSVNFNKGQSLMSRKDNAKSYVRLVRHH